MGLFEEVEKLINKQKNTYMDNPDIAFSFFTNENRTIKDYNGRQILELLQNSDDSGSKEIIIELNREQNRLIIKDSGSGFSIGGIKSLLIPDRSPKKESQFIGNKGLGFRSILNWVKQVEIKTKDISLSFSERNIIEEAKALWKENLSSYQTEMNLPCDKVPLPIMAIPKVCKIEDIDGTEIILDYKSEYLDDIETQLNNIEKHVLLFVNHLEKIKVNDKVFSCSKTYGEEKNKILASIYSSGEAEEKWTIYRHYPEKLPKELIDENNSIFDISIAVPVEKTISFEKLIYDYFPTRVKVGYPCIIHATLDLDSSRNHIDNTALNVFVFKKIKEMILSLAEYLKTQSPKATWEPLRLLLEKGVICSDEFVSNNLTIPISNELLINNIYPSVDGNYRNREEIINYNASTNSVLARYKEHFSEVLIESNEDLENLLNWEKVYSLEQLGDRIDKVSKDADLTISDRAKLIHSIYIIKNSFYFNDNPDYKFNILINEQNEIILNENTAYAPRQILDFEKPDYLSMDFVNKELFEDLLNTFNISKNQDLKQQYRDLVNKLKSIVNIQDYDISNLLKKIESYANKEVKEKQLESEKKQIIIQVLKTLIGIYKAHKGFDTILHIYLENKNGNLLPSNELLFGNPYECAKDTEDIFSGIYDNNKYVQNYLNLCSNEDDVHILEGVLTQLQVSSFVVFDEKTEFKDIKYLQYINKYINPSIPLNSSIVASKDIKNLDDLSRLNFEDFIKLISQSARLQEEIKKLTQLHFFYRTDQKPSVFSYVAYKVQQMLSAENRDFYIFSTNDELSIIGTNIDSKLSFLPTQADRQNVKDILKIIAINLAEVQKPVIIKILNSLERFDKEGKLAQQVYKTVADICGEKKENSDEIRMSLKDSDLKLFAYSIDKKIKGYFPANMIFYSDNATLPKQLMIKKQIKKFAYPLRQGAEKIPNIFGVRKVSDIKLKVIEESIEKNNGLNREFNEFFEKTKPYFLLHRFKSLNTQTAQKDNANYIKNCKIVLVNRCKYSFNVESLEELQSKKEEIDSLDNFDYIRDNNNLFYVCIPEKVALNELCANEEFCTSIAEIVSMVFLLTKEEEFVNIIHDFSFYTKTIQKHQDSISELDSCYEYLGLSRSLISFWRKYLGNDIENATIENLAELIYSKYGIRGYNFELVDYETWHSDASVALLREVYNKIDKNILQTVDLSLFHRDKIINVLDRLKEDFKKSLYKNLCSKTIAEQKLYLCKFDLYKEILSKIDYQSIAHEIDVNYESIIICQVLQDFGFTIETGLQVNNSYKYDAEYEEIIKQSGDKELISISFFSGEEQKEFVLAKINKLKEIAEELDKPKSENEDDFEDTIVIKKTNEDVTSAIDSRKKGNKSSGNNYNPGKEKIKKIKAKKAEKRVYKYLCSEYGKENVFWISSFSELNIEQSDDAGYDIYYYDKNKEKHLVEVKCSSGNYFYITPNELAEGKKEENNYHIALVNNNEVTILENFLKDKSSYLLTADSYYVSFDIKQ